MAELENAFLTADGHKLTELPLGAPVSFLFTVPLDPPREPRKLSGLICGGLFDRMNRIDGIISLPEVTH